jgi:hypothetical protein
MNKSQLPFYSFMTNLLSKKNGEQNENNIPRKRRIPKTRNRVFFPYVKENEEKMIELTSVLLVAFVSGSLMLAFANYAKK